jgi:hypothetical protein
MIHLLPGDAAPKLKTLLLVRAVCVPAHAGMAEDATT